jgi:hypothetical protein
MLNWPLLVQNKEQLTKDFRSSNKPFPWLMMDGFLSEGIAEALGRDFDAAPFAGHKPPTEMKHQVLKRGTSRWEDFSPLQKQFFENLSEEMFISYLSDVTGISPLYADPFLYGGGLHEILPGGWLNVHTDFNFHPRLRKLRALNLLLYLNQRWEPHWNGSLELWDQDMLTRHAAIQPGINRMVVFETSEISFHGHPVPLACPDGVTRRSLAAYYYTDWPEELGCRLGTNYQLTPGQWARLVSEVARRLEAGIRDVRTLGDQLIGQWQTKDVEQAHRFLTNVRTTYSYAERDRIPAKIDVIIRDPEEAVAVDWVYPELVPSSHVKQTDNGLESVGDDPYFWIVAGFDNKEVDTLHIKFYWPTSTLDDAELPVFYFDFGLGSGEELARRCPIRQGTNYFVFMFNQPLRKLRFDPAARPGFLANYNLQIGFHNSALSGVHSMPRLNSTGLPARASNKFRDAIHSAARRFARRSTDKVRQVLDLSEGTRNREQL